jgi:hypothetical protein
VAPQTTPPLAAGDATALPFPLPRTTQEAAGIVGTSYHNLFAMIRCRKIPRPAKNSSGDYLWTSEDIERARQAMRIDRRLKANRPPKDKGAA